MTTARTPPARAMAPRPSPAGQHHLDVSGTYFAGTAFAAAIDQINATSFTVDASWPPLQASFSSATPFPRGSDHAVLVLPQQLTSTRRWAPALCGRGRLPPVPGQRSRWRRGGLAIGQWRGPREPGQELIEAVDPSSTSTYLCTVRVPLALGRGTTSSSRTLLPSTTTLTSSTGTRRAPARRVLLERRHHSEAEGAGPPSSCSGKGTGR